MLSISTDISYDNIDETFIDTELSNLFIESQDKFFDIEDAITQCKKLLNLQVRNTRCNILVIIKKKLN
jgi:hypothetical protein